MSGVCVRHNSHLYHNKWDPSNNRYNSSGNARVGIQIPTPNAMNRNEHAILKCNKDRDSARDDEPNQVPTPKMDPKNSQSASKSYWYARKDPNAVIDTRDLCNDYYSGNEY